MYSYLIKKKKEIIFYIVSVGFVLTSLGNFDSLKSDIIVKILLLIIMGLSITESGSVFKSKIKHLLVLEKKETFLFLLILVNIALSENNSNNLIQLNALNIIYIYSNYIYFNTCEIPLEDIKIKNISFALFSLSVLFIIVWSSKSLELYYFEAVLLISLLAFIFNKESLYIVIFLVPLLLQSSLNMLGIISFILMMFLTELFLSKRNDQTLYLYFRRGKHLILLIFCVLAIMIFIYNARILSLREILFGLKQEQRLNSAAPLMMPIGEYLVNLGLSIGVIAYLLLLGIIVNLGTNKNKLISYVAYLLFLYPKSQSYFPIYLLIYVLIFKKYIVNDRKSKYSINLFFVNSLQSGGAEKAVENLITVSKPKTTNYIILLDGFKWKYEYREENTIIHLSIKTPIRMILSIFRVNLLVNLYGIDSINLSNAHLLKSHLFARLSIVGNKTLYIFHSTSRSFTISRVHRILYKYIYNGQIIGVLSENIAKNLISNLSISPQKYFIFKNSIPKETIEAVIENKGEPQYRKPYILFCGRLENVKRPDFFIDMFYETQLYKEFDAIILGEGSLKNQLKMQVNRLNLEDHVNFEGYVTNPFDYFKNAKVTILCSEFEASPMVILECLYSGGRIVSYDCDYGPREVLEGELERFLVKSRNMEEWNKVIRDAILEYPNYKSINYLFENRDNEDTLDCLVNVYRENSGGMGL